MTTPSSTSAGTPMPPIPLEPEPDQVTGPDTEVMHGLVLDYTYSGGRHYRLLFDHEHRVTFEMPDLVKAEGFDPVGFKPLALDYRARELKPGLVFLHWIIKQAPIHVALTIDLEEKKLHVAAMMPPNRWEFFDTAVIHSVTAAQK